MKIRKVVMCLFFVSFSLVASASIILQEWTFDEPSGTGIHSLNNSGTPGDASWGWANSSTEFSTDGNGNLVCIPGTTSYKSAGFATPLSGSDTYSFELVTSAWNIASGTEVVQLQAKLGTGVEIYTAAHGTDGLQFTFKADGNYQTVGVDSALNGTTEHKARIDFNIAAGTAAFFVDDVDVTGSWLNLTGLTFDNADNMVWQKSGNFATVDPSTELKITSQTLSVVPEPATVSFIVFVGIGSLIARRFMM